MKKQFRCILAVLFFITLSADLNAQKIQLKKANKLYELKAYAEAIPYYERALKKDSTISQAIINVADCYRLINDSRQTAHYFGKVINLQSAQPIHTYYYAQALMQLGSYDAARQYMSTYTVDDRGRAFEKAIAHLSRFFKDTAYYKIEAAPFNSGENDFSPVLLDDSKVVFVSARKRTQMIRFTHSWTDWKYYTMYITYKDELGDYIKPEKYAANIQIRFNDGPVCFDKDGTTIYVTRNNFRKGRVVRSSGGDVKLNLYKAEYDSIKKRFVNLQGFDFNSDEYNTAHPAINPDGTKLYFSSDMPGGQGGMDLWVTTRNGSEWSRPQNLGDKVNTPGDDVFPYLFSENKLYFSSNGLDGIGGLDIFSVKLKADGMPEEVAKNIGAPINSSADDFGIVFYSGGKKGFFSSNRENFNRDDNIYEFTVDLPEKQPYVILVMDSISHEQLESTIIITDSESKERIELSEKSGQYTINLYPERLYSISASADSYMPKANISYATPVDNSTAFEILLTPKPKYFIAGTVFEIFDDSTFKTLDSALVTIKDDTGSIVCVKYITDISGKYRSCDLLPRTTYIVTASKEGFFAKTSAVPSIPPGGAIRDFYLSRIVIGKAIKIENIYFDLNKSDIRPDAAAELDKIVALLNENPDIIIELSSHTDCRASYSYNMSLSDRRAKSSAAYIVSKGIDASRINGKGYGESMLVNDCKCEGAVKSDCSEEEHQQNRRTEFKVTGFVKGMGKVDVRSTD